MCSARAAPLCGQHFGFQAHRLRISRRDASALHRFADQDPGAQDTHRAATAQKRKHRDDQRCCGNQVSDEFSVLHMRSMQAARGRDLIQVKSKQHEIVSCLAAALASGSALLEEKRDTCRVALAFDVLNPCRIHRPRLVARLVTNEDPGGYWEDKGYNWFSGS